MKSEPAEQPAMQSVECAAKPSASDSWPAAATMCCRCERCRMHDVGIFFAYLGDARNNVGNSVGAEICERTGLDSLEVTDL